MDAPEIGFKIILNGTDATKDLTPFLLGLNYTDNLSGKADEITVDLDNSDKRFLNDWFLSAGMKVDAYIGQMYCGKFQIDQPSESGPPHQVSFRAQSATFTTPIRSKKSFTHNQKSLEDIVKHYANTHSLKLVGTVPNLNLKSVTQSRESDIDFLHNLAHTYGCICAVKGDNLVFDALENVWKRDAAKVLRLTDDMRYAFSTSQPDGADAGVSLYGDTFDESVQGVVVESSDVSVNPNLLTGYKYLHKYPYKDNINGVNYSDFDNDYTIPSNIAKVAYKKAESAEEAKRIATGLLLRARMLKHTGTITLPGDELLVAGNSIDIREMGKRSGFWLIEKSVHQITKSTAHVTTIHLSHGKGSSQNKAASDNSYKADVNAVGASGTPEFNEKNF